MCRPLAAVVLPFALAACGGSGDGPVTGLTLTVHYDSPRIANISVDGVARTSDRDFGPYVVSTTSLAPGGSVGLVFSPDDAGELRVCADALDASGLRFDRSCTGATLVADRVATADLTLDFPF
jgi:hypothetical protein